VQAPFIVNKARTIGFTHSITVTGDQMRYTESTFLDIYDKSNCDRKDLNTLQRVG